MSALLFNAVTFDQASDLYTYNYAVQNDSNSTIWNVDILVGNRVLGTVPQYAIQPLPPDHTSPYQWVMYGSFSGWIANAPYSMLGGFYEWYAGNYVIQPGTTLFGFSVTTRFAPTLDNGLNDYFLYGSEGVVAYGNIAVPSSADWLIEPPYINSAVPEPSTWLMLLIGFIVLCTAKRRSRRFAVHPAPLSLARR